MSNAQHTYLAETPTEARAASAGRTVLYVLMFGTLGALATFAFLYMLAYS